MHNILYYFKLLLVLNGILVTSSNKNKNIIVRNYDQRNMNYIVLTAF